MAARPRLRDLGIETGVLPPGPLNAITDVPALEGAGGGPVAEGNVGGGTGMLLFGFKGGVGTASRVVEVAGADYTLGVLVQGNTGRREDLLVDGVPVGRLMPELPPERGQGPAGEPGRGSVIV